MRRHDISRISLRPQAKLAVSPPQDPKEQEADRVAKQVIRRPDSVMVTQEPGLPYLAHDFSKISILAKHQPSDATNRWAAIEP